MRLLFIIPLLCLGIFFHSCTEDDCAPPMENHQEVVERLLGNWNILFHTTHLEKDGPIFQEFSANYNAEFKEEGQGFFTTSILMDDLLYSYYEEARILVLHRFSSDALLYTSHNSKAYEILEMRDDFIRLQYYAEYQDTRDNEVVDVRYTEELEMTKVK